MNNRDHGSDAQLAKWKLLRVPSRRARTIGLQRTFLVRCCVVKYTAIPSRMKIATDELSVCSLSLFAIRRLLPFNRWQVSPCSTILGRVIQYYCMESRISSRDETVSTLPSNFRACPESNCDERSGIHSLARSESGYLPGRRRGARSRFAHFFPGFGYTNVHCLVQLPSCQEDVWVCGATSRHFASACRSARRIQSRKTGPGVPHVAR
ncbi:hypothetical protein B0H12DRAFT_738907 [Mycena haematopus]|nr:hypothetical protein B0H12DRAFT_738907 [Mycena haematopus]